MIDLGALIGDLESGTHVVFDYGGRPMETRPLPEDPAVLLSRPVTDAVKQVDDNRVGSSMDRDGLLWAEGFALGPEVVRVLGPRQFATGALIEAVRAAGFEWTVIDTETL